MSRGRWRRASGYSSLWPISCSTGFLLSKSARISLSLYHAAALFGFFLRLGLIMLTMILIAQFIEIDKLAMGVSAVVSYLVLLSWEALAVAKGAERELEWSS